MDEITKKSKKQAAKTNAKNMYFKNIKANTQYMTIVVSSAINTIKGI